MSKALEHPCQPPARCVIKLIAPGLINHAVLAAISLIVIALYQRAGRSGSLFFGYDSPLIGKNQPVIERSK